MTPLVIIPARGGSKGLPRKNIKILNDKPLIHFTIEAARELFSDDQICVTTDDDEIVKVVEETGLKIPFIRPKELSGDAAGSHEVLLHALNFYAKKGFNPDVIILLQPTSPFRKSSHIQEALKLYSHTIDMVVSVKETASNPYYVLFEENEHGFLNKSKKGDFIRRQDCPKVWELNGAIYIINCASLRNGKVDTFSKTVKYVMDESSSHDIDSPLDWLIAEHIAKSNTLHT